MTDLNSLIHYYQLLMHDSGAFIAPSTLVLIKDTILYLEELEKIRRGTK